MMDLYTQFVDIWTKHFPTQDPPLIDFHSCTSVSNDVESVDIDKLRTLYKTADQTSDALKLEWQKADLVTNFLSGLVEAYTTDEKKNLRKSKGSVKSPVPTPRYKEYSMKDGLGMCINSSVETFVNVGLGTDAIDVTENHEIQVNSLVGETHGWERESESKVHDSKQDSTNLVTQKCQDTSGLSPNQEFIDKNGKKDEVDSSCTFQDHEKLPVTQRWSLDTQKQETKNSPNARRKFSAPEKFEKPCIKPRSFSRNVVKPRNRASQTLSDQVAEKFFSCEANNFKSNPNSPRDHAYESKNRSFHGSVSSVTEESIEFLNKENVNSQLNAGRKSPLRSTEETHSEKNEEDCSTLHLKENQSNMKRFSLINNSLEGEKCSAVTTKSYRKLDDQTEKEKDLSSSQNVVINAETISEEGDGPGGISPKGFSSSHSKSFHGLSKKSSAKKSDAFPVAKETLISKTSSLPTNVKRTRVSDFENLSVDFLLRCPNDNLEGTSSDEDDEDDDYVTLDSLTNLKKRSDDSGVESISVGSIASGDSLPSPKVQRHQDEEIIYDNAVNTTAGVDNKKVAVDTHQNEHHGKGHVTPETRSEDESADEIEHERLMSVNSSQRLRQQKLHMRQILVKGILESERSYLETLQEVTELKRRLQEEATDLRHIVRICNMEDVTVIFQHIEEIHKQHSNFVNSLQVKVNNWSDNQQIGETFKELVVYFPLYMKYVSHNHEAQERLQKCCQENEKFKEMVTKMKGSSGEIMSLQEVLFTPVQRLQRNTLVLHDLIKHTPEDHADHKTLTKALDLADHNLRNFGGNQKSHIHASEDLAHLVKSGFVVEMEGRSRKLRFLFLFNDVLVCTKHKQTGRNKTNSFEVKWFVPIRQIELEDKIVPTNVVAFKGFQYLSFRRDRPKPNFQAVNIKEDLDSMKKKIVSLKSELRNEVKSHSEHARERLWSLSGKVAARNIDKLKKKIEEQEAALILASPRLPLHLKVKDDSHDHTILLSTDFEREEWRDAIQSQQRQHQGSIQRQLSGHDIQLMINDSKQLPQVNKVGTVLLRKDEDIMSGALNVTIHKLNGLEEICDTYVELHLDSYGHFFMKARTRTTNQSVDPTWDEDFELDLEGSQSLRILCYKKSASGDMLIGRSALELSKQWLSSKFQEQKISMNELSLTLSVRHTPATKTLKRTPSKLQGGIFGAKIGIVVARERKTVPTIVTACIKEVEKRGLNELGIYRVSGVTSDVQKIKKAFDKNVRAGTNMVAEEDIHAVTGALKLYFRELPEPLFTEARYKQFLDTVALHDGDAKEKVFLDVLHNLPDENYYSVVSIVEHLIKVSKMEEENKMSISNLSTIFGPTLLHPAVKDVHLTQEEMMRGAQDVFLQAGVLQFLLTLAAKGKSIRRSEISNHQGRDVLV